MTDQAPADPRPAPELLGFPPPGGPLPGSEPAPFGQPPMSGNLPGYGPPPGHGPAPTRRRPVLPGVPVEYHQLWRGPRHAWWKPVASIALALALAFGFSIGTFVFTLLLGLIFGVEDPEREILNLANLGPLGFLYVNLAIIGFIPATFLAVFLVHGVRPGYLSSVAGRLRWRWLLRCAMVLVPVWVVYLGSEALLSDPESGRPPQWPLLLAMTLVMTPFQAAAEEYLTRGFLAQSVGSWFAARIPGLVVTIAVSAAVFALLHGSFDPWVFAGLVVFAVTASLATWRTGGLEAAIVMHAVNNLGVFFLVLLVGGWSESFIGEDTTGTPLSVGIALLVHGTALALILWQARRAGVDRFFRPPVAPAAVGGPPAPALAPGTPPATGSGGWQPSSG